MDGWMDGWMAIGWLEDGWLLTGCWRMDGWMNGCQIISFVTEPLVGNACSSHAFTDVCELLDFWIPNKIRDVPDKLNSSTKMQYSSKKSGG